MKSLVNLKQNILFLLGSCLASLVANQVLAQQEAAAADASLGFGMTIVVVGLSMVFGGLFFIFLLMVVLQKVIDGQATKNKQSSKDNKKEEVLELPDDTEHAIALALYMDPRIFDEELTSKLSIKKVTKPYSPWWHSGKTISIYNNQHIFERPVADRQAGKK
ncbi:MAG: OadG family protein [Myxococcales bacterium]|nr:MAG: OadG family protein [Myxococcales bacterium]